MQYPLSVTSVFVTVLVYLLSVINVNAQFVSAYDANGNIRSTSNIVVEETPNKTYKEANCGVLQNLPVPKCTGTDIYYVNEDYGYTLCLDAKETTTKLSLGLLNYQYLKDFISIDGYSDLPVFVYPIKFNSEEDSLAVYKKFEEEFFNVLGSEKITAKKNYKDSYTEATAYAPHGSYFRGYSVTLKEGEEALICFEYLKESNSKFDALCFAFMSPTGVDAALYAFHNSALLNQSVILQFNKAEEPITPPENNYSKTEAFSEGMAVVTNDEEKYGYINESNKLVIPMIYDYASEFKEGFGCVVIDKKYGFINKTGKVVIPLVYESTGSWFKDGCAAVKLNGKWGFIDAAGKLIVACRYDDYRNFDEGFATLKLNNKWICIDATGKTITHNEYEGIGPFTDGLASFQLNGKYGFMNILGKEIIPPLYDDVYVFAGGLARVQLNGKWIKIDKTGKQVDE